MADFIDIQGTVLKQTEMAVLFFDGTVEVWLPKSQISDENEKLIQIDRISKELDIDKNHILSKIDENLQSIADEIKQKDKIKISEYLEKSGMEANAFLKFIDNLGISYFKKADLLIFSEQKIEEAKKDIKYMLIDKSKSEDFISLGTYDITSNLIEDLIKELEEEEEEEKDQRKENVVTAKKRKK